MNIFKSKNKQDIKNILLNIKYNLKGVITWEPNAILKNQDGYSYYLININKNKDIVKYVIIDYNLNIIGGDGTSVIFNPPNRDKYFIANGNYNWLCYAIFFDDINITRYNEHI